MALPAAASDAPAPPGDSKPFPSKTQSKLSSALQSVIGISPAVPQAWPGPGGTTSSFATSSSDVASAWFAAGLLRERNGKLQVYVNAHGLDDDLRDQLRSLGADIEIESAEHRIVQALVPYGSLEMIAALPGVRSVTEPSYGVSHAGGSTTQGDAILNFDDLRALQGLDGTNVTVGVISDGIAGLADAVASDDLPMTYETRNGSGTLTSTAGGIVATSFRADDDLEAGLSGGVGAEGTAILEIVHDIAPGASLRFANFSTHLEFMAAVNYLAGNSDIVIDDIGFFARPTDGTSDVSVNTSSALNDDDNPIRAYVTSVGNGATRHYEAAFSSGADGAATTGFPGAFHRFPAAGATDALGLETVDYNTVRLSTGQSVIAYLTWEDSWVAPVADYDLYFIDPAFGVVGGSAVINALSGEPLEAAGVTYTGPGSLDLHIAVQKFDDASAGRNLELVIFPGTTAYPNGTYLNFNTVAGSVGAQGDAGGGVISVGAINASDPGADTIAAYSSRGPTGDGRTKPDITAIDGVNVSGSAGFPDPFFGTSAAAPHIAGLAALLLQFRPDLKKTYITPDTDAADREALRNALLNGAIDLGAAGVDNTFGFGKADGPASAMTLFSPPTFPTTPSDVAGTEGTPIDAGMLWFSDLNATDTHTAAIDWGDGFPAAANVDQGLRIATATHTYDDNGSFTIRATVTDDDGMAGAVTFTAVIANAPPVASASADLSGSVGDSLAGALATFTDPGYADTHTATIDWGDGSPIASGTVDQGAGEVSGSHAYSTGGLFTITVTVTDDDGGSDSVTLHAFVEAAPTFDLGANAEVSEGSLLTLDFTFLDAASETHDATIDWGDGSPIATATVDQGLDSVSATHTYTDNGTFVIAATVTDDTGLAEADSLAVTVLNATPELDANDGTLVADAQQFTVDLATFTDAGVLDTHTATIDWGDGTVATGTIDQGTVSGTHTFVEVGTHLVTVTVTDNDGGAGSAVVTLVVYNPPPVPSVGTWGMAGTAALLALAFVWHRRREQVPA